MASLELIDQPHLSGPIGLSVHDRPLVHLDDGFRGRWAVAQSTVWSFRVVVFPPFLDKDLGSAQGVEDLAIQEFIAEPCIEFFAIPVLSRGPWLDVSRLCTDSFDPILDRLSGELRAVAHWARTNGALNGQL